jgi:hypothetical protein
VVTIVLYFGDKKWDKNLTLHECLNIPEKLLPYTSDYKINVFNIAHLTPEQVNLFKSDFRLVADFFVKRRINGDYKQMTDKIKHTWEVLNLLKAVTGDNKFDEIYYKYKDMGD